MTDTGLKAERNQFMLIKLASGDKEHAWECADCGYIYGSTPDVIGFGDTELKAWRLAQEYRG